ncbi:phosphoribosylanthranilate isomerase [Pullulanibacillus sp. KACC 23026]|uniref:phosphoribosylanthranilate isomerase n=1 Tax=Pullulanibacillus sp. KACC 23026 TaxID=3028315 RepID=UPI0023B16730|nr:phosphoribosylanthranilate isomerase [Pullulanibacillus sp. KACC 23026]WEG11367.1 phosphoribosylanthranilate isomerase [Pullulanibacillus sp. KACC 23026]
MTLYLKYCGNRSYEDYKLVSQSRATHLGFIFVPTSKRYVSPERVGEWLAQASSTNQKMVGVFVNPSLEELNEHLRAIHLDVIQLHGTETPCFIKELRGLYNGEVWKVIHHEEGALEKMKDYAGCVDAFLVDSKVAGALGGTGQAFDWSYVPDYLEVAHQLGMPCMIAGGVTPENVAALLEYKPDGIDLASGIEASEKKSRSRIEALERKVVST